MTTANGVVYSTSDIIGVFTNAACLLKIGSAHPRLSHAFPLAVIV
jgi:hypothetical protein